MHNDSNNPYAFPLPACTAHTFDWEDGEHDTCYRCGADRPGVEAVTDDALTTELHRRGLPTTVSGLADEARRRGMKPSEFLRQYPTVGAL